MHAVSVSGLKPNPEGGLLQAPGARDALATALFRDGELSLVRAAQVAELDVASFIADLDTLEQWL